MAWLLDTNAWIHYLKDPGSRIRAGLERRMPDEIVTCAIVKAELLHGAQKYGAPERRTAIVHETLAPYRSLPFDDDAAEYYARIRHELEELGGRIGPHDLLIGAICLAHGCTLVTGNLAEFRRVRGLGVEDWSTE